MVKEVKEAKNRARFTVLTVFMVLAVVFSGYFACTGLDHDCAGEDCQVCLELRIIRSLFEGLGRIGFALLSAGFAAAGTKSFAGIPLLFCAAAFTLVSLKTKYNS